MTFTDILVGRRCLDRMVFGFTTTYVISAYHHLSCEFESRSCRDILDTTLYDKVTCDRFSPGIPVSSTNKTERHDITEILLKVALNTINTNTNTHVVIFFVQLFTINSMLSCCSSCMSGQWFLVHLLIINITPLSG